MARDIVTETGVKIVTETGVQIVDDTLAASNQVAELLCAVSLQPSLQTEAIIIQSLTAAANMMPLPATAKIHV